MCVHYCSTFLMYLLYIMCMFLEIQKARDTLHVTDLNSFRYLKVNIIIISTLQYSNLIK